MSEHTDPSGGTQAVLTERQQLSDVAIEEYNRKSSDTTWDEIDRDGRSWLPSEDGSFMHLARRAKDNGYRPLVPLYSINSHAVRTSEGRITTKTPCMREWQHLAANPPADDMIRGWLQNDPNIGFGYVHDHQLLVFDIDTPDRQRSAAIIAWLLGNIPGDPPMMRTSKPPKVQLYYRAGEGCHQEKSPEVFYNSGQTVLFAVHPEYKVPFSWRYGSPASRHIDSLPLCTGYHLLKFMQTWGGPNGDGDPDARYGIGNGTVKSFLRFARDNKIELLDIDDIVKAVSMLPKGQRHILAVGAVTYARNQMHAEMSLIQRTIGAAYEALLNSTMSGRELRKHLGDFRRLVGWTETKVEKGK